MKRQIYTAADRGNVISFPAHRSRPEVPPFDPANPLHIAAWESLWALGQHELEREKRSTE